MNRHEKCTSSNILRKTSVLQPKSRANITSFKQQNPITVSEKLNNFEKKFETVIVHLDQLKIEVQLSKEQSPNTVLENLNNLEEKLKTVVLDVTQLGTELQLSKDELVDSRNEILKVNRENNELHSLLDISTQEIQKNSAEIYDLKKKIELQNVSVASGVTMTDVTLPRRIFQRLPCETDSELDAFKEDLLRDIHTLIYMVSMI